MGLWAKTAAFFCLVVCAGGATAEEPAQAFLDALRHRGYFDVAFDYLDAAATNPALPASFKETILFEKGATLVDGAHQERDPDRREQQLDEAQRVLQQFAREKPGHILAVAAKCRMGNVVVERARNRIERAKRLSVSERQTLHRQARDLYDQAGKVFSGLADEVSTKLKSYPAGLDEKTDARRIKERDQYREDLFQARLLAAVIMEEMADTFTKSSQEWSQKLTAAAEAYKKFFDDYRTRLPGQYARMYQARCYQKLGKHKDATALFNEVLSNSDEPQAFRTLKLKTMTLAVESWVAQQLFPEIIDRPVKLIEGTKASEERTDDMMALRLAVARGCKAYADQLKSKSPRDAQIPKLLADGRKYVTYVARFPSVHQEAARRLMPDFGGDAQAARPEPKTFAEAKEAAKEAIGAIESGNLPVTARNEKTQAALRYCRLALKLGDAAADDSEVNLVRYYLCYLLYRQKSYYEAVVVGEFVARRFPNNPNARQCAKIALASVVNLHAENTSGDKEFEERLLIDTADYIVSKWPNQPEAADALNALIPSMIRANQLEQAQAYVAKIPTSSPHRGIAELKTGQALWNSYLQRFKQVRDWENGVQPLPEGTDLAAHKRELEKLKVNARQTLFDGVERMRRSGDATPVLATAVLSLAQIYVDTNEAAKAVTLLEDPRIGVLTLVKRRDSAATGEGIPEETYKTALRAYISSLADGGNAAATIEKARGVMDALKAHLGKTAEGQQTLVRIYIGLARDLQRQMEFAEPTTKKSLGLGFEAFLKEVAADATDVNVLNWVGDTYRGMGESFGTSSKTIAPEAKVYFMRAAETYKKILDKAKADPSFLPEPTAITIRIQLAKAKKGTGDFSAALDIFESVLKANPTMLTAQIDAARMYQEWGGSGKGREENYLLAIVGALPDKAKNGRNTIWGWGEIAMRTANNSQFSEQFYDARYNLALCRYHYALAQTNDAERKKQLAAAKRDIAFTAGLYPDLGGEEKRKQFDNLLKIIQRGLGERTDGLRALTTPAGGKTTSISAKVPANRSPVNK